MEGGGWRVGTNLQQSLDAREWDSGASFPSALQRAAVVVLAGPTASRSVAVALLWPAASSRSEFEVEEMALALPP